MSESRIEFLSRRVRELEEARVAKRREWEEAASRQAHALIELGLRKGQLSDTEARAEQARIEQEAEREKPHIIQLRAEADQAWEEWADAVERLERALAESDTPGENRAT